MFAKNVLAIIIAAIISLVITVVIVYILLAASCVPHPPPPTPIPIPPAPLPTPPRPIPPQPGPTPIPDEPDHNEWLTGVIANVWSADRVTIIVDHINIPLVRRRQYNLWGIEGPKRGSEHYRPANKYVSQLLSNKSVSYVELENGAIWLYSVEDRAEMINFIIVRAGWARATDSMFKEAQEYAQKSRLGIWGGN